MSWSRRAFACSAASAAEVDSRLRCAIRSTARSDAIVAATSAALAMSAISRTERSGTTRTVSSRSTRSPRVQSATSRPGCRSRMIRKRQTEFTATAASMATTAAVVAVAAVTAVPENMARPTIPAARPWSAATPPSVAARRHTAPDRMTCVEAPAATPSSGPPSNPASTTTGVAAVYQLLGPSWTTTCLAAAATTSRREGDRNCGLERHPGEDRPQRRSHRLRREGSRSRLACRVTGRQPPSTGAAESPSASPGVSRGVGLPRHLRKRQRPPFEYPPIGGLSAGERRAAAPVRVVSRRRTPRSGARA